MTCQPIWPEFPSALAIVKSLAHSPTRQGPTVGLHLGVQGDSVSNFSTLRAGGVRIRRPSPSNQGGAPERIHSCSKSAAASAWPPNSRPSRTCLAPASSTSGARELLVKRRVYHIPAGYGCIDAACGARVRAEIVSTALNAHKAGHLQLSIWRAN